MKLFVSPGKPSDGARLLTEKLGAKGIKIEGSKYVYKEDHLVINWGSSKRRDWFKNGIKILNDPQKVAIAVNKIETFKALQANNISIPDFTTKIDEAKKWFQNGDAMVFCRTKIGGSGGEGIVIAQNIGELVPAPLYSLYKKKKHEYRVAVVDGVAIDFMAKKKRTDWKVEEKGDIDKYIRSHDKGWVFCRNGVNPPQTVLDLAVKSIEVLGLDFGSVDIIYNETDKKAYVLEVNTAPGLEEGGTSLERYSKAFKSLIENKKPSKAEIINEEVVNNVAAPVAAVAQVAPVVPVAQAPAVQKVNKPAEPVPVAVAQPKVQAQKANNNKAYKLDGLKDIEITQQNGKIVITGKADGVPYRLKVLEADGNITSWVGAE